MEELKNKGNAAFSSGQHDEAIKYFTEAINIDGKNAVLFSNRSAAYASLNDYSKALEDANNAVELRPEWAKGHSRRGTALYGLGDYTEAKKSYEKVLELEPDNAQAKKSIKEIEDLASEEGDFMKNFHNMFDSRRIMEKITKNPKLAGYMAQPDFLKKVNEIQKDPKTLGTYFDDPRIVELFGALIGADSGLGSTMGSGFNSPFKTDQHPPEMKTEKGKPQTSKADTSFSGAKETKPFENTISEADKAKELGNQAYKKHEFEEALKHYDRAWELDSTNITYLTNKAAVYYEMAQYDACIKECELAVEKGVEMRSDFKLIAKAFARIGNAYFIQNKLEDAIKYYSKSLTEFRSPEIVEKLKEAEKLKAKLEAEAYISPEIAEQERNAGNELFKEGQFAEAIKRYSEAIKRNPKDPRVYSNRATCYTKLMSYPEALKDCEECLKLDPKFTKAHIRRAAVYFAQKNYSRSLDILQDAMETDEAGTHRAEIEDWVRKCTMAMSSQQTNLSEEEITKRAAQDPEIREILADPVMRQILQQMSSDPAAIMEHMKNPSIAKKVRKLMSAGIIRMGP